MLALPNRISRDSAQTHRLSSLTPITWTRLKDLVISGLVGVELRHRQLRIGEALLAWHRLRPPCGYLDRVSGSGMAKALGRYGGHCMRVREGGLIQVGDRVTLL